MGVLRACLDRHGTTSCILTREYKDDLIFPNAMLGAMLQFGCYAVYLEEIFKFLPKVRQLLLIVKIRWSDYPYSYCDSLKLYTA